MNQNLAIQVDAPFITVEEYARRTGRSAEGVRKLCLAGRLPVRHRNSDRERYEINMIALAKEASSALY